MYIALLGICGNRELSTEGVAQTTVRKNPDPPDSAPRTPATNPPAAAPRNTAAPEPAARRRVEGRE
jgi:hypothetical protein